MGLNEWNYLQVKLFKDFKIDATNIELVNRISNKLKHFKQNELNLSTIMACKKIMEVELDL